MELAINTIVILILGIAILGIVIGLVNKFGKQGMDAIKVTEEQKDRLVTDARCQSSLEGSGLCVYPKVNEVARGEAAPFLVWVSNNYREEVKEIVITSTSTTSECQDLKGINFEDGEVVLDEKIKPGVKAKRYPAFVNPDAGTCSFKVEVRDSDNNVVATETFFLKTK
jgi:hypothetical protein